MVAVKRLPPPAIAWFAELQAEERRECEPCTASKPSVTVASGSSRAPQRGARSAQLRSVCDSPAMSSKMVSILGCTDSLKSPLHDHAIVAIGDLEFHASDSVVHDVA